MRIWSLHPQYLDVKGLVALWREGLLAQAVLANKTRGYKNHPQLERFKNLRDPLRAIGAYLSSVHEEALHRGYRFDSKKILRPSTRSKFEPMKLPRGQLDYEWIHLKTKLSQRDPNWLNRLKNILKPKPHPIFRITPGGVADWEKI